MAPQMMQREKPMAESEISYFMQKLSKAAVELGFDAKAVNARFMTPDEAREFGRLTLITENGTVLINRDNFMAKENSAQKLMLSQAYLRAARENDNGWARGNQHEI